MLAKAFAARDYSPSGPAENDTSYSNRPFTVKDYLLNNFHGLLAAWESALLLRVANSKTPTPVEIRGAQVIALTRVGILDLLNKLPASVQNTVLTPATRATIGNVLASNAVTMNSEDGSINLNIQNIADLVQLISSITTPPQNDATQSTAANDNQPIK